MRSIGIVVVCHQPGMDCVHRIVQLANDASMKQPSIILENSDVESYVQAFKQLEDGKPKQLIHLALHSIEALHRAGAEVVAIPNNAIHCVFAQLVEQSSARLISMVDAVSEMCKTNQYQSICLLGTTPLIEQNVYTNPLKQLGIEVIVPKSLEQDEVHQIAMGATLSNKISEEEAQRIRSIVSNIHDGQKFDALLIACSELMLPTLKYEFTCIDPFQLLAEKVFEVSSNLK